MRILYLGLPLGALELIRAGHVPVVCCVGFQDAIGTRRLRRTLPHETLVLGRPNLEAREVRDLIASSAYDVVLSWFWPQRIPASVLEGAPRGGFGVHPSLLPRWRGPDPYFHAIRAGDASTGVTLHRLAEEYDTGAIVAKLETPIGTGENAWRLAKRLDRPSLALLVACANELARGSALEGTPQDESLVTLAPKPDDDAFALRFAQHDADELARLVRAAAPEPGATVMLGETLVAVLRGSVWTGRFPGCLEPGEAFVSEEGVVVRARRDGLLLEQVRVDDDDGILEQDEVAELFE